MLKQNLLLFWRSISRQRVHFTLTISGLILGLTAVMLAFTFVRDENGFDQFHSKADRIFRVNKWIKETSGDRSKNAESPGLMAPTIQDDFPEVELATHIAPWFDKVLLSYQDQNVYAENWVFADSNFFRVFDFQMIRGAEAERILSSPGQIIITTKLAQSLFGYLDPIGKTIKGQNNKEYMVAGIVEAAPRQSHLQFDALVSWSSTEPNSEFLNFSFFNNWLGQTVYTYLLLRQPEQLAAVNAKLPEFTAKYMSNRTETYSFFLQPFSEIYLQSYDLQYLRGGSYGSASFLRIFSIIAFLILLVACFNYINITTAKSLTRAREVGLKKVLGARSGQLLRQFLTETSCMTLLAGALAIGLTQLLLPRLNQLFQKEIPLHAPLDAQALLFLLLVILSTSLVAGLFPAWILTRFSPISALRDKLKLAPGGEWPRQILTTLQLAISVGLITGTLVLQGQFNFLLNKDLGFDKQQVLVMNTPPGAQSNAAAFKNELLAMPGVLSVSMCQAAVGEGSFTTTVYPDGSQGEEVPISLFRVDSNYMKTFGMELSEGRFLGLASDFDPGNLVVNEALVKQMGWEDPLQKTIQFQPEGPGIPIVGVLKDFHFSSLHQKVDPLVMYLDGRISNTSVRLEPSQLSSLLPQMEKVWKQFEPRYPFDYYFVDEFFAKKYLSEQRMLKVIGLFSFLAIFIACLGLYGLTAFAIARRTKEIGIRKVLGASVPGLVILLSKRFVIMVGISLLLAIPIIWHYSAQWLQGFAYHIPLGWGIFALAGSLVLLIVLITVSLQSIKAALTNPILALKNE